MRPSFTLATRRSALALAQSRAFADTLRARYAGVEIRELQLVTSGDRITHVPLAEVGGKGLFTKEIEQALLASQADFAVHSFKDVPAVLAPAFVIACVPPREQPSDALVLPQGRFGTLSALPRGARVGTSSLRRQAQLAALRPDLALVPLRGNVDTRLRKLDAGEVEAVILACAGLQRLGLRHRISEVLTTEALVPAPGQGALALECRADDPETRDLLAALDDAESAICVDCERGAMAALGADCTVPFGAHARRDGPSLAFDGFYAPARGAPRRFARTLPWPGDRAEAVAIGKAFGEELARTTD